MTEPAGPPRGMALLERVSRSLSFRSRRLVRELRQELFAARLAWLRRARMKDAISDGVTIIAVTWNTLDYLQTLLAAIQRFTDRPVSIVIVDNGSTDGTRDFLRTRPDITHVQLRRNWGHGLALDAGVQAARTRFVITLDIDAFPIAPGWVEAVIGPLRAGSTLAGAHSSGYIHPCFMAIERHRFIADKHTFAASYHRRLRLNRRRGLPKGWDAGKLITLRDQGHHHTVEVTSVRGPGALGTVFGDVVYHHFYSTRLTGALTQDVVRSGVTPEISRQAWHEATDRYLGQAPIGPTDRSAGGSST